MRFAIITCSLGVRCRHITVIFHPISNISMTATIWMLATVTSERHWAIWKPLQHRALDTKRRAQTICIVLILVACEPLWSRARSPPLRVRYSENSIAVLFCLPTFFELRVAECLDAEHQRTEHLAWPTALRLDELYLSIYSIGMNSIFITFGPFAIITCLTAVRHLRTFFNRFLQLDLPISPRFSEWSLLLRAQDVKEDVWTAVGKWVAI